MEVVQFLMRVSLLLVAAILVVGSKLTGLLHDLFESWLHSVNRCINPSVEVESNKRKKAMHFSDSGLQFARSESTFASGELKIEPLVESRLKSSFSDPSLESCHPPVKLMKSSSPSGAIRHKGGLIQPAVPVSRYFNAPTTRKKYYAVVRGFIPGIYESWEDCELQVRGYSGQVYKSFKTKIEAEQYLHTGLRKAEEHALEGHSYVPVGLDDAGKKVYRCEYCLDITNITRLE